MSLLLYLNQTLIPNNATISLAEAKGSPEFEYTFKAKHQYTILMYDITVNYLHYLRTRGQNLVEYIPPERNGHTYVVDVYESDRPLVIEVPKSQEGFRLSNYGTLVGRTTFSTSGKDPLMGAGEYASMETNNYNIAYHGSERFVPGNPLTERQQKYCSCRLKVLAKGNTTNPNAVCAKSTGTTYRDCWAWYAWERLPDDEIAAYAKTHNIQVPNPYNREQMLQTINQWLESKK
jgi:hypothetical protein